ncbi:MAG: hypothetical protein IIY62_00635, partial [Kiritimatiellae bacterium]|nr:hypothetical protein [Kiritimatiellia bacterium]
IRPIDIRLNAAHPDLPLAEAVTYTGAPSTVLIRGVPGNCGRWAITAVFVAATYPDGSTTTRAAVQSANGVWVATLPATARSGRTENGLRVMADGIDENGEAVGGYVLGVADFAVASLDVTPAPQPGETSWQMLYFDAVPGVLRKGDVTKVDGVLKLYNGTAWEAFANVPAPSTADPQMDGTATAGTSASYARGDHVHPTDTSRVPTSRTVNGKALANDVTLTGADIAVSGTDTTKINAALAGKLDKSGGTMTGELRLHYLSSSDFGGDFFRFKRFDDTEGPDDVIRRNDIAGLADRAANPTNGNLAALDANGNPTDAGWTAGDLARYSLVAKTIDNGAVTLDDRAMNAVAVSSALASLTINFPTATSGKVRDFGLRLSVASGITTAPELVLPQGVTFENADGEVPEIGADGAATILYFTETASGVFLVKGEVVTAIS